MCLVYDENLACVDLCSNEKACHYLEERARAACVHEWVGEIHYGELSRGKPALGLVLVRVDESLEE